METESFRSHESESDFKGEWYYDDEQVSKLYALINDHKIPREETRKLLHKVQSEFQNLDSRADKTKQEVDKMSILNNIANQLVIEVGFDSAHDNPKPESTQEIEGVQ